MVSFSWFTWQNGPGSEKHKKQFSALSVLLSCSLLQLRLPLVKTLSQKVRYLLADLAKSFRNMIKYENLCKGNKSPSCETLS